MRYIGISGSRTHKRTDKAQIDKALYLKLKQIVLKYDPTTTIFFSGAAKSGADHEIELVCAELKYQYDGTTCKPDFSEGYAAWKFFERNKQLAHIVMELYCLWDEKSKGTKHIIDYMQKLITMGESKQLHIITFQELMEETRNGKL
jgi:hypothetical protein